MKHFEGIRLPQVAMQNNNQISYKFGEHETVIFQNNSVPVVVQY